MSFGRQYKIQMLIMI